MFRLACIALLAGLAGCAVWSPDDTAEEEEKRRGPITPAEALQQTEEPERDVSGSQDPDGLSRDIERLQDARRKYENERAREAAERRRKQAECLEKGETRRVPVEDGGEESFEYCAPPPSDGGQNEAENAEDTK